MSSTSSPDNQRSLGAAPTAGYRNIENQSLLGCTTRRGDPAEAIVDSLALTFRVPGIAFRSTPKQREWYGAFARRCVMPDGSFLLFCSGGTREVLLDS